MFLRTIIAAAAMASAATAVIAQSDPVEARRKEMKAMGQHIYGSLNRMQRGQDPFDKAKVDAAFVQFAASLEKLPALFPEGSKSGTDPGDEFRTSDKIWQDKKEFEARLAKVAKEAADNRAKITNVETLKAVYPVLRRNCEGCHETYLIKN
jgi:cytochrome c556